MKKIRYYLSKNQEEKFLNKQAKRGYRLKQITPFFLMPPFETNIYEFDQTKESAWFYQVDYRSFVTQAEKNDYLQLLKDAGWTRFTADHTFHDYQKKYIVYRTNEVGLFSDTQSDIEAANKKYDQAIITSLLLILASFILKLYPSSLGNGTLNLFELGLKYWFYVILAVTILVSLLLKLFNHRKEKFLV